MRFRSDNVAPAAPEILEALNRANAGAADAYGADDWSGRLNETYSRLFEHEVFVYPVATGTAANAIALAAVCPPWGAILAHQEAHIEGDEAGAPEFYSGGAKIELVGGAHAKIGAREMDSHLRRLRHGVHSPAPAAISVSQASERGTVYRSDELAAIAAIAKHNGLRMHMDGARLANALAFLGCSPADITWRAGVDLLSFGATKNGALFGEAIITFDNALAEQIERRRKRGGHLFSKARYGAAQLLAYVEDDLWLRLGARANDLAARIGLAAGPLLSAPVESNQVFIKPGVEGLQELRAAGVEFYEWGVSDSGEGRLVVSWDQDEAEVDALCTLLAALQRSLINF